MLAIIKALLYPAKCIVCGQILDVPLEEAGEQYFCEECLKGLFEMPQAPYDEEGDPEHPLVVHALFPYVDDYQYSVLRWKYQGIRKYAKGYGQLMALGQIDWREVDVIVPVPVSPHRYHKRGFNQALDLAGEIGKLTGVPVCDLLLRTRDTKPQSECSKAERRSNIKGSIGICEKNLQSYPQRLRHVVLVDDIYTTGSTARECAKVLRALRPDQYVQVSVLVVTRGM
ncbi:MAG: ComF family protein [Cellulosilyticaceae bacterium]